jgi:hypothetical protein
VGEIEIGPLLGAVPEIAGAYLERLATLLQDSIEVAVIRIPLPLPKSAKHVLCQR